MAQRLGHRPPRAVTGCPGVRACGQGQEAAPRLVCLGPQLFPTTHSAL